MIIKLSFL